VSRRRERRRDRTSGAGANESTSAAASLGAAPWKVNVAAGVVLLVALWPLVHRVLVARFDVNPWKLGGFAMYATPAPPLVVAVFGLRDGKLVRVTPQTLPLAQRDALRRFEIERHALGELRRPDALAREILAADASLDQLSVVVQRTTLDRASARLASERMQYSYDRDGPREVRRMTPPDASPSPASQTRTSTSTPK
jgi:hypothetical protein